MISTAILPSPVGPLCAATRGETLHILAFDGEWGTTLVKLAEHFPEESIAEAPSRLWVADKLDAYWAGDLSALVGIAVDPMGTTFQRRVWSALLAIPSGETCSYGAIARAVKTPTASRAVGSANGKNPISIVIPCHRVIGQDGSMTGYGGGLERKRFLLDHEAKSLGKGSLDLWNQSIAASSL